MALNSIANIILRATGDTRDADTALGRLQAGLRAVGESDSNPEVDIQVKGEAKLAAIASELQALERNKHVINLDLEERGILAKMEAIQAKISALNSQDVTRDDNGQFASKATREKRTIEIDIQKGEADRELAALDVELAIVTAKKRKVEVQIDVDSSQLREAERAGQAAVGIFGRLGALFRTAGAPASALGESLSGVTVNLGAFGVKLGPVVAIALAAAAAIGVSLVGALALLATALAGAVAAIGALATAFAAALGPAVALAIAAISKIVSIFKVFKGLQDAQANAARKSADGTKAAAQAEDARRSKLEAIRSALQSVVAAERGLANAREQAAKAIDNANQAQIDAASNLQDAIQQVKQSTVDAYQAIKDAAQDAKDAILGVQDAQLGVQEASLGIEEAQAALDAFRKTAGLAGNSLNGMFDKFQNVDFQGDIMQSLLQGGASKKDALELEKLILALKRAKLQEKEANNTLAKSEDKLSQARKTNADYQQKGIAAYKPLTDAIKAQKDAANRLADATQEANRLNAIGIEQSDQVLSAKEALISAEARLREARRKSSEESGGGISDELAKANEEMAKLSPAAKRFGEVIFGLKDAAGKFFGPAVDSILDGLTSGIQRLPRIMAASLGPFTAFGKTVGDVIDNIFKSFDNPVASIQLGSLVQAANELAKALGNKVFIGFIHLFLNAAMAAMPYLIDLANKLGDSLLNLAPKAGGKGFTDFLDKAFMLLGKVWGLVKALGGAFLAFFNDTAAESGGFIQWITDAINKFTAFLKSPEGKKEIQQFFQDTLPLVKSFLGFIGQLILFFIRFTQIVAPALTALITGFSVALKVINFVLGALRPFLQIAASIALAFASPINKVIRLATIIGELVKLVGGLGGVFGAAAGAIGSALSGLPHLFSSIGSSIGHWIGGALNSIVNKVKGIPGLFSDAFSSAVDVMEGFVSSFYNIGKQIVMGLVNGIKSIPGKALGAIKDLGKGIIGKGLSVFGIGSPSKVFHKIGEQITQGLSNGISANMGAVTANVTNTLAPVADAGRAQAVMPKSTPGAENKMWKGAIPNQTNVGDIILQTPGGGTPDGLTAARLLQRELKKRG